jgi:hypothetical protein
VGQTNQQYEDRTSGNPPQSDASNRSGESDDAFFAKQREDQDPGTEGLASVGDIDDLDNDTLGPDAARNMGGGEGDFRQNQDAGSENRQEW